MDQHVKDVARRVTRASEEGMPFPEAVRALAEVGVERYVADLVGATKTYYLPDGGVETVGCGRPGAPAASFDAPGVEAAIRAVQAREIDYLAFCERIAAAGCVGYIVSIAGRRALYYGRTNDSHVEWFPGAR